MSQHSFVHIAMSPFRLMCLGISSSLCQSYNEHGMPHYVASGIAFKEWAESQNVVAQWFLLALSFFVLGLSMTLENTFGASLAPAAVVALGAVYAFFKATGLSVRANKTKTA
ncbi:expressed unknown protein [Seminavis robusta]|uniref:Uncharacterized protein n=1 Tax=Seminavis robusta TaxID=568900 RepID=A0A9N8EWR8_9STRA|nr:expressed unknown protein [Seminavis robusta]|eukprot:Sro1783_g297210.1 n/a (112) ;mRNA; f:189-524